ncbi:GAP family protein [Streptomyces winkii]|uniref:GAP family protein n=1 Tax=Streptomyces winkii TaxID=3051178 RepID=UPI0028D1F6AE|nr:GAP family protein [Streptomyces sp. DSM 40971]
MDGLRVLPLAVTMMAGPQIMSAIVFVTAPKAVRVSLAFVSAVAAATAGGLAVTLAIVSALGGGGDLGDASDRGSVGQIVEYGLVALLALLALKNWRQRATVEPPKWLGTLMSADPRRAFRIGLLVILLMPSDLMVMLTVGVHLRQRNASYTDAYVQGLPFVAATVLIAALPLLLRLAFARRAEAAMPRVRDWMNTHSWLVNIAVCLLFIVLILA